MSLTRRQGEADRSAGAVGDHASLGAIAAARSAKRFTHVALGPRSPFFGRPRRLVVRPDRSAVEKCHAQFKTTLLDPFEKPFPDAQLAPADEGLRRPPPRHQIGRHAAPLRPILMPPDNCLDRLAQGDWLRLAPRPALLDQRPQPRPLVVIQDNKSALLCHSRYIGTVLKP